MPVVRGSERPTEDRGDALPSLQRLVDRAAGSNAVTVLVNVFDGDQQVPAHTHDVEEVLVVTEGTCSFEIGDEVVVASAGDAVIVPPRTVHGIGHSGSDPATVLAVLASPDLQIPSFG